MVTSFKRFIKATFYYLGVYRILIALRRDCVPIIMIHGVLDEELKSDWEPSWKRTSAEQLARVVDVLKIYFDFISMDEVSELLSQRTLPKRPKVCLSFDDGYRNNLTYASPILRLRKIPSICYLATGYITHRIPFWIDRFDYVLQHIDFDAVEIKMKEETFKIRLSARKEFERDYLNFRRSMKQLYVDDREMMDDIEREASRLESLAGCALSDSITGDSAAEVMTIKDVASTCSYFSFGSHTINHLRVNRISETILLSELTESKKWIEDTTSKQCVHFCYPNGDFDEKSLTLVKQAGYSTAVTTVSGANKIGDSELLALRRVSIPDESKPYEILHSLAVSMLSHSRVLPIVV